MELELIDKEEKELGKHKSDPTVHNNPEVESLANKMFKEV